MSDSTISRVLLVGHCRPDQYMLRSAIEGIVKGAEIVVANDPESVGSAEADSLYLVNRVLDGAFPDTDGITLVERLAQAGGRAMLISNLPDKLAESESRGGLPGFGKSELRSDKMREALIGAMSTN
ncbi:MAG: hypothetical protein RIB60_08035 [Phycisphaerales bacterium]